MTREELINSDEYLTATVDCIVVSRKPIKKMREELKQFFLDWKAELLSGMKPNNDTPPQLNKPDVSSSAIQAVCDKVAKFSDDTFGNARPYTAPLHHLKKEVDEAITDGELVEFADCLLLLLDAYRKKFGGNVDMLLKSASDKVDECYQRSWGEADENGVVEHVR